jgi:hypothetical protein
MDYDKLLDVLKVVDARRVVVTGPQRAGTAIAATILAADLKLPFHHERAFGIDEVQRFFRFLEQEREFVVHAPAMSSVAHYLADCEVVFMRRPLPDIRESERRIGWQKRFRELEMVRYFHAVSYIPGASAALKLQMWAEHQKSVLGLRGHELEYDSLAGHRLWVDKEARANFTNWQTKVEEPALDYRI